MITPVSEATFTLYVLEDEPRFLDLASHIQQLADISQKKANYLREISRETRELVTQFHGIHWAYQGDPQKANKGYEQVWTTYKQVSDRLKQELETLKEQEQRIAALVDELDCA